MTNNPFGAHGRLAPIAAAVAFLWGSETAIAGVTLPVQNCNDHGSGSLRATVAELSSGDTVDLSQLN
jgi:hypothetical protein